MATRKKRVSFVTRRGKRVSFLAKTRAKKASPKYRRPSRARSRISAKTRKDTERLIEAGLGYLHPAAPVIIAAGRVVKDILEE